MKKHSFWWENSAPDFALQPQLPVYTDVVIVGAGFAGISTAYWLARLTKKNKKSFRVIILDEAPHAGFKATGRMTGSIYLGSNVPASLVASSLGKKNAKQLYRYSSKNNKLLENLASKLECDAEFNGGFRMAATAKDVEIFRDSAELLSEWGYYPVVFDHNQSQHVTIVPLAKSSMFIPHEGMIDPFGFVNDLARHLRKHNVWIVYGARVDEATVNEQDGPQVVLSNGHVISARHIVHTTDNTVPWDRLSEKLTHTREQAVRTTPFSEELDEMPLPLMPIELNGGLDSARIHERSIVMVGGKSTLRKKDPEIGVLNDNVSNQRIVDHLDSTMMRHFPFSNQTEISHSWTYIETTTEDGLPFIGELPEHNGHHVSLGYGRNKFGLAFIAGKNVAERLLRVKVHDPEFNLFSPKRVTRGEK